MIWAIRTTIKTWLLPTGEFAKAKSKQKSLNCDSLVAATIEFCRIGARINMLPLLSFDSFCWLARLYKVYKTLSDCKQYRRFNIARSLAPSDPRVPYSPRTSPELPDNSLHSSTPNSTRLNRKTQLPAETSNKQTTRWARGIPGIRPTSWKKMWNWNACAQQNRRDRGGSSVVFLCVLNGNEKSLSLIWKRWKKTGAQKTWEGKV